MAQVGAWSHRRTGVQLEVGGVHNESDRRVYRKHGGLGNRMRDRNGFHGERAQLQGAVFGERLDGVEVAVVLPESAPDQVACIRAAIDRQIMSGQNVGQGADVVFVAMGENHAVDGAAVGLGAGEHHPGVDDHAVVVDPVDHHVHPELAESSKRDDFKPLVGRHGAFSRKK